jgi:hypothetical protein
MSGTVSGDDDVTVLASKKLQLLWLCMAPSERRVPWPTFFETFTRAYGDGDVLSERHLRFMFDHDQTGFVSLRFVHFLERCCAFGAGDSLHGTLCTLVRTVARLFFNDSFMGVRSVADVTPMLLRTKVGTLCSLVCSDRGFFEFVLVWRDGDSGVKRCNIDFKDGGGLADPALDLPLSKSALLSLTQPPIVKGTARDACGLHELAEDDRSDKLDAFWLEVQLAGETLAVSVTVKLFCASKLLTIEWKASATSVRVAVKKRDNFRQRGDSLEVRVRGETLRLRASENTCAEWSRKIEKLLSKSSSSDDNDDDDNDDDDAALPTRRFAATRRKVEKIWKKVTGNAKDTPIEAAESTPSDCVSPNVAVPANVSPLFIAASSGRLDVVDLMLADGADVNGGGECEWSPLHAATVLRRHDIMKRLLAAGASTSSGAISVVALAVLDDAALAILFTGGARANVQALEWLLRGPDLTRYEVRLYGARARESNQTYCSHQVDPVPQMCDLMVENWPLATDAAGRAAFSASDAAAVSPLLATALRRRCEKFFEFAVLNGAATSAGVATELLQAFTDSPLFGFSNISHGTVVETLLRAGAVVSAGDCRRLSQLVRGDHQLPKERLAVLLRALADADATNN